MISWQSDCRGVGDLWCEQNVSKSSVLPKLFVWSASDEAGLKRLAEIYAAYLSKVAIKGENELYMRNLAYTLSVRRSSLPWKSFVTASSMSELRQNLQTKLSKPVRSATQHPKLGFIFSGQGAQWYAMGRELMRYPAFSKSLQQADLYLKSLGCQWSLLGQFFTVFAVEHMLNTLRRAGQERGNFLRKSSYV